ncbi:MAG TPA: SIS domain-containing protein [Phycisphaerales bacterium]|nr:SIS domain-containing protein [Phycisphaerales bacterium]
MNHSDRERFAQVIDTHKALVGQFESRGADSVIAAAQAIVRAIEAGGTVYLCGNGGSAADAQHIAGELVGRFTAERRALPAVALSTDTSVLTCIGNDYCFEDVFARQVEALVCKGDVLWAFSTSGASANVLKAAQLAKERGAVLIAFTGRGDSPLQTMADVCLCAADASTARSQEIHQLAYHIICELVERRFVGR